MIPPFNGELLPPGIHRATFVEFETIFVTGIASSRTRLPIYRGYRRFHDDLVDLDVGTHQWINGSYVTTKVDPNDIDLVTHCDGKRLDNLSPQTQRIVRELFDRDLARARYTCHSFCVPHYPKGHPKYDGVQSSIEYWRNWFGRTRQSVPKGFVEIDLSNGGSPNHV